MGLQIGQITGYEIKKNRDGEKEVLLLQVEVSGPDDIQTVEYYQSSGQDSNPPVGSLVAFSEAGRAWKISLGADDRIIPSSDSGEYKIYSSLAGVVKAFLKLFKTGLARIEAVGDIEIEANGKTEIKGSTVDLNGDDDNAVRFSVLETAFNQLKADFNAHTQTVSEGIALAPTPSTADISGAKVDEVRLPT
jgi:hypothetical protein